VPHSKTIPPKQHKIKEEQVNIEGKIGSWIEDYNTQAPHSALGMLTPAQFYEDWKLKSRLKVVQI